MKKLLILAVFMTAILIGGCSSPPSENTTVSGEADLSKEWATWASTQQI